jgi:erythromycin esterase
MELLDMRKNRRTDFVRVAALFVCFICISAWTGCSSTLEQPANTIVKTADTVNIRALAAAVIPFRTAEPGGDYSDLAPLKQIVGNARLVSLGEGTHGTREFFQMKHRVLEYLVKEMGFTMFAIEATWAEANRVNDYVMEGKGDPAVLLSNLYFWTWNTQEVLDMIRWMRAYNQSTTGPKVGFYGFDMQFSRVTMNDVESYVQRVDADAAQRVRSLYSLYREFQDTIGRGSRDYGTAASADRRQCRENVQAVHELIRSSEAAFIARSSRADYARALRAARIVVQNEEMRNVGNDVVAAVNIRDRAMAENASWLLQQGGQGAKIVLWAHNGHVNNAVRSGITCMGVHLRREYGNAMVIAGFSFGQGGFNAIESNGTSFLGLKALSTNFIPETSFEYQFERLRKERFILDLRSLPQSAEIAWLRGERPLRIIGSVYAPNFAANYFYASTISTEYDVMIHFATTKPSVLLPFRFSLVAVNNNQRDIAAQTNTQTTTVNNSFTSLLRGIIR